MATIIAAAAVGALVCSLVCKDSGQKAQIQQEIMNNIDISAIANVLIEEGAVTHASNSIVQNIDWKFEQGCVPPSDTSIIQNANINAKVYNVVTTKITQQLLNKVQAELENQLKTSVQQVDKKLFSFLEKNMNAEISQQVDNEFKDTIEANVTVNTISKIFSDNKIQQTVTIVCDGPMPQNFKVDQEAQITLAVINMINNTISQLAKNETLLKIFNPLYAKASQEQTDPLAEFLGMLQKFGLFIVIGIVLLILIGVIIFVVKKFKSNRSGNTIAFAPQT